MPGNIVDENAFTKVHSIFFYRNRMILKILQIWTSWILKLKMKRKCRYESYNHCFGFVGINGPTKFS